MSHQKIVRVVNDEGTVHETVYKVTPGFFSDNVELIRETTTKRGEIDEGDDDALALLALGALVLAGTPC